MSKLTRAIFVLFLLFTGLILSGQNTSNHSSTDIGINYFGELGFRPGVELDLGINLWQLEKEKRDKKRLLNLKLRPSFAYYHYSHYSNNFLLASKLNYQIKYYNKKKTKYLFLEPFVKIGYLRYFLAGDVFTMNGNDFEKLRFRGSNSLVVGTGLDLGGYLSPKLDWLFGLDYYAERTEDKLTLHRFVAKLGIRLKLNSK